MTRKKNETYLLKSKYPQVSHYKQLFEYIPNTMTNCFLFASQLINFQRGIVFQTIVDFTGLI